MAELFFLILGCLCVSICGPEGTKKAGIIFTFFADFPGGLRGGSGAPFLLISHVFYEGDFQKLAFGVGVWPKGPQKDTNLTPKMTRVGVALAPLSDETLDSENHPHETTGFSFNMRLAFRVLITI